MQNIQTKTNPNENKLAQVKRKQNKTQKNPKFKPTVFQSMHIIMTSLVDTTAHNSTGVPSY